MDVTNKWCVSAGLQNALEDPVLQRALPVPSTFPSLSLLLLSPWLGSPALLPSGLLSRVSPPPLVVSCINVNVNQDRRQDSNSAKFNVHTMHTVYKGPLLDFVKS